MGERPDDGDEALTLLEEVEVAFRWMIGGVFRFLFVRLPAWLYELFQDFFGWLGRFARYAARFTMRLVRTAFFGAVWGALVFGPLPRRCSWRHWTPRLSRRWAGRGWLSG